MSVSSVSAHEYLCRSYPVWRTQHPWLDGLQYFAHLMHQDVAQVLSEAAATGERVVPDPHPIHWQRFWTLILSSASLMKVVRKGRPACQAWLIQVVHDDDIQNASITCTCQVIRWTQEKL